MGLSAKARPSICPLERSSLGVVSRASPVQTALRNCTRDGVGLSGASNKLRALQLAQEVPQATAPGRARRPRPTPHTSPRPAHAALRCRSEADVRFAHPQTTSRKTQLAMTQLFNETPVAHRGAPERGGMAGGGARAAAGDAPNPLPMIPRSSPSRSSRVRGKPLACRIAKAAIRTAATISESR
jgi:hypothetical protein